MAPKTTHISRCRPDTSTSYINPENFCEGSSGVHRQLIPRVSLSSLHPPPTGTRNPISRRIPRHEKSNGQKPDTAKPGRSSDTFPSLPIIDSLSSPAGVTG